MIVLSGFLKEQITILFQKNGTRVPDCHRCSKAVTNLIPSGGRKIIQILKAHKVVQRTKVVLISQNYTLGLNVRRYVLLAPLRGGACFCTRGAMQGYDVDLFILALAKTVTPGGSPWREPGQAAPPTT